MDTYPLTPEVVEQARELLSGLKLRHCRKPQGFAKVLELIVEERPDDEQVRLTPRKATK